jgi:DNA-binding NtrC family response regulator
VTQHILAVDDEPHMIELLQRIITEKTPYHLTAATNALEVPKLLEQQTFDVIITDLKMAGLDGLGILRLVKERKRSELVIIITAFGTLDTATEALSLGVFDYLTKPFRKEQLLFSLERGMQWQRLQQEAAQILRLFDLAPLEAARRAFDIAYLQRLAQQTGQDLAELTRRSGLSGETIKQLLDPGE